MGTMPNRLSRSIMRGPFRRIFFLLLLILLWLPVLCAADEPKAPPAVIRAGAYDNHPKVYFDDNAGQTVGLFPEILQYVAEKENWRIEYIRGTWTRCLERLENGRIDVMPDVAWSEARAKKYAFSRETVLNNWGVVYARQNFDIESFLDLAGARIAVMAGSIHTDGANGIKRLTEKFNIDCRYVEAATYREVFALIDAGRADAGVVNRIFGRLAEKDYSVEKTSIIFNPRQLRFAFPPDGPHTPMLIEKIDRRLRELKKDKGSLYYKALDIYLDGLPRALLFQETTDTGRRIALTEQEEAWLKAHPVIRFGADPEFAPFEYIDADGAYRGIASDYINILQQRLGLNMRLAEGMSWRDAVAGAEKRDIDVLPCVGKTRDRMAFFLFSTPYLQFQRVIITRIDFPFIAGVADIRDVRVAVQAKSSHEGYIKDHTDIAPMRFDTLQQSLLAVSGGRADAFVGNIASAAYWIRQLNLTNLKVSASVSSEVMHLYFAVRKDWPELVGIINKGLASITSEEENRIYQKWVSVQYNTGISPHVFWKYILWICAGALTIMGAVLAWNRLLKRQIVHRKKAEAELKEANARLKDLDRLKSMFIASMSHELRTPLNSIIGFTGVILQGMSGEINDKQKDQLNRVYKSARHLLSLITDVIDISKIEAGRMDVYTELFPLADAVEEAAGAMTPQLKEKRLILEKKIPPDLQVCTDRKRLSQVIINFLSNAVKYTEAGTIAISAERRDGEVCISVRDTGIGIGPSDMPKLFEAFERLETRLKVKAGGTGLGLYLTRKIVTELLGGTIHAESRPGKGSVFSIRIPWDLDACRIIEPPKEEDSDETGPGD